MTSKSKTPEDTASPSPGTPSEGPSGPTINPVDNLRKRLAEITEGTDIPALLPIRKSGTFSLTAGELRQAARSNPSHKISKIFLRAVKDHSDSEKVTVDRVDLQAVLENGTVEHQSTLQKTEGGLTRVHTKRFLPKRK